MRYLLLVTLAAACGGNTPPSPEDAGGAGGGGGSADAGPAVGVDHQALSGSRLKTRVITGADGSQVYAGMFDSQRMENCSFRRAGDGQTRCLPDAAIVSISYSDAACTQPITALQPTQCMTGYGVIGTELVTCPASWKVHPLTPITPAQVYSLTQVQGSCTTVGVGSQTWYSVDAEIAPTEFVAGTEALQ